VAKGLVTAAELASGKTAPQAPRNTPALTADKVPVLVSKGSPSDRATSTAPLFNVGQPIRTRNMNPLAHTRLPRYARGRAGTIDRVHGVFVFPDTNALYQGENPQYLYSVQFTAPELWGAAAAARDSVYIDLWESYLER
jgi:nitrile hydratase subunit beta